MKNLQVKVGIFALIAIALTAYMSMKVSSDVVFFSSGGSGWFYMKDASGIVKGSALRSAGITVGTIERISLVDGVARVDLKFLKSFKVYNTASVEVKSLGILGDKVIAIYAGDVDSGLLPVGGQIKNVKDTGSLDTVIAQVGEITSSLKQTAKALEEATTAEGTQKHVLGRIVQNIEKITGDVAQITAQNKGEISEIVGQVNRITKSLDDLLNSKGDDSLKAQLQRTMKNLDDTMKNVNEISGKISRGEGTIGRLINDEETVEGLNTAIDGVNSFLDTAGKTQTSLDFNTQYLSSVGKSLTSVGVKLQPGLDRYYYIGLVDDPAGVVEKTRIVSTGSTTGDFTEEKTFSNKMKLSLLFGKNYYDFSVRGGLIENAGGVGVDYWLIPDALKASVEAFDFSKLNLRAQLQYNVWKGLYLTGGITDALNNGEKRSSYVGAGLFITNDDVKFLMTRLPTN